MFFIKILFIILMLSLNVCHGDVPPSGVAHSLQPHQPLRPPKAPQCNGTAVPHQVRTDLKIRLPFMDMEIANQRNLQIMQEPQNQQIFILHGHELFQLFVGRREKRLSLIGHLAGRVKNLEPLGAEVIAWHNYYIIVVALEEYLEIYQIPTGAVEKRIEITKDPKRSTGDIPPAFEPIQQLTLLGRYQKMFLLEAEEQKVMLIVAVNFTKLYGKFRTFEWSNTYFESIEDLTVPPIQSPQVVGTFPKYLISGKSIRHQSRVILTVYEIKTPTMNLRSVQTLTVSSRTFHATTFRGLNYIIACQTNQKICNTFRMKDGQFNVYKRRTWKELAFDKFTGNVNHFLAGSRQNEVRLFTSGRLDCFGSFTTNESDISAILTHRNDQGENYVLLSYRRPFYTLVRMVEVEVVGRNESGDVLGAMADFDDANTLQRHQHQHIFEDTIGKLRSLLLQRRAAMDVFRKIAGMLAPRLVNLQVPHSVSVHSGNIGIIKVVDTQLRSPLQILQRIEDIARLYRLPARPKRSADGPRNFTLDMPANVKVKNLTVHNLLYSGDILDGFYLVKSRDSLPILSIRPRLVSRVLKTKELLARQWYRLPRRVAGENATKTIKTRRLQVKRINDVAWNELHDVFFLKNRDTKLEGRLILQAATKVVNLSASRLNGLVVDQLFNLKQPQVVHTNLLIARFFVRDLRAERVNGLNFAEDIVFSGRDDFVETPVNMYQISVAGDLLLSDGQSKQRDSDVQTAGFQQYYTGKVIINGTLTVNNIARDDPDTEMLVNSWLAISPENIKQDYLLKNEPQTFNHTLVFGNAKITTPSLNTKYLNEHPTGEHLLKSAADTTQFQPLYVVFMSAHIEGGLICRDYKSKVRELHKNAVLHGEVSNITGVKTFVAPLVVENVMTLQLNGMSVSELVLKSDLLHGVQFSAAKSFEDIEVAENTIIDRALSANYLNNLPLSELLNYDYHFGSLTVPHKLRVTDLVFHEINGMPFNEVLAKFNVLDDVLVLHKDLIIIGNVQFAENLQVEMLNDVAWRSYQASLVRVHENAVIKGRKRFLGEVTITKELQTPMVKNVVLEEMLRNILTKSTPQRITGAYTFDGLRLTNVDVSVINDIPTAAFLDLRATVLRIDGDLVARKLFVNGHFNGVLASPFDFSTVEARLENLSTRQWRNLLVYGNCRWNSTDDIDRSQYSRLQYLHKNAVRCTGDQVITGNVRLRRPLITKMLTTTSFPPNIDIEFIAKDCLYKNATTPQVVYGSKVFVKPLQLPNLKAKSQLNTNFLNKIDVLRFNSSLYRLSSGDVILGPINFKSIPVVNNLTVEGRVNGMRTDEICRLGSGPVPPLKLQQLFIENTLDVKDINGMSLSYLLENRVTKHGEALEVFGLLTFESLALQKEILLQSINGIPIDNLVFTKSDHLQAITGTKSIVGNLLLAGPAYVLQMNGRNLIETYQQTLFTDRNYILAKLDVTEATFEQGLILMDSVVSTAQDRSSMGREPKGKLREKYSAVMRDLEEIDNSVMAAKENGVQSQLMYLDYDLNTKVIWALPNETVGKSLLYETKRISACERQMLQLQTAKNNPRIFVSNITAKLITSNAYDLSVKAENYCQAKYRKVKSKITIANKRLLKVFGMRKHIESVQIFAPNKSDKFVLLHAVDLTTQRNEVRILKIDSANAVIDWQAMTVGVGTVVRLFQFPNQTTLVSSATVSHHPAINIYAFSMATQQFKLAQVIDGDYDLIEMTALSAGTYHLILSCRDCQRINIYECTPTGPAPFCRIYQILKPPTLIDKLLAFRLKDGNLYLLVLAANANDYYHLYKYSHIRGWVVAAYGYFHNIDLAVPLVSRDRHDDNNMLLLLCSSDNCGLVRAFIHAK